MFETQALLKAPNMYFKSPTEFKGYVRAILYEKYQVDLIGKSHQLTLILNHFNDLYTYEELSRFINAVLAAKPQNEDYMPV
jgi:hypothetical protein